MGPQKGSYLQVLKLAVDIEPVLESGHCEACEASDPCNVFLQSVQQTSEAIVLMSCPLQPCTVNA